MPIWPQTIESWRCHNKNWRSFRGRHILSVLLLFAIQLLHKSPWSILNKSHLEYQNLHSKISADTIGNDCFSFFSIQCKITRILGSFCCFSPIFARFRDSYSCFRIFALIGLFVPFFFRGEINCTIQCFFWIYAVVSTIQYFFLIYAVVKKCT